jgi:hypothetical protein
MYCKELNGITGMNVIIHLHSFTSNVSVKLEKDTCN